MVTYCRFLIGLTSLFGTGCQSLWRWVSSDPALQSPNLSRTDFKGRSASRGKNLIAVIATLGGLVVIAMVSLSRAANNIYLFCFSCNKAYQSIHHKAEQRAPLSAPGAGQVWRGAWDWRRNHAPGLRHNSRDSIQRPVGNFLAPGAAGGRRLPYKSLSIHWPPSLLNRNTFNV